MPQRGFSYEKLPPLDNDYHIARQIEGIYSLLELETAGKLLLASQLRVNGKSWRSGRNTVVAYLHSQMGIPIPFLYWALGIGI